MTSAAGNSVTAPVAAMESYISRWETGKAAPSARYRQLLDAVLGPGAEVPAPQPSSGSASDPRKWVRAMHSLACDIAGGTFRPGGQLRARAVLAHRYGLTVRAVTRAQDELLSAGILSSGQVYGTLYVTQAPGRQVRLADPDQRTAVTPPGRAGHGAGGTAPATRNPRPYALPDTSAPAACTGAGTGPGPRPASPPAGREPPLAGEPPEFLLVKECAAQARVLPRTIYELVRHGRVEAIRLRRDIRIYARSWQAYLQTPAPDLRLAPEPDADGHRDGPPAARTPQAEPQPGPARSSHTGAPPAVFRAPR
jgi:hypothetical protein